MGAGILICQCSGKDKKFIAASDFNLYIININYRWVFH